MMLPRHLTWSGSLRGVRRYARAGDSTGVRRYLPAGLHLAVFAALVLTIAVATAGPVWGQEDELTLSDFDRTGLDVEILVLVQASEDFDTSIRPIWHCQLVREPRQDATLGIDEGLWDVRWSWCRRSTESGWQHRKRDGSGR